MPDSNGLTDILTELKSQAAILPEDVSRQMILAAVLAVRRENAAIRQRLRWVARLAVSAAGISVFSIVLDIAIHGEAAWAQNLIGVFK